MILNTILELKETPIQNNNQNQIQEQNNIPVYNLNLAERDQYLYNIENQIHNKRNLLITKRKYLEKTSKENKFLEGVRNDYNKYNRFIVHEKEEQLRALGILQQYIDDIIISGKLTDEDIKKSKKEQRDILKEIKDVKNNLDSIIQF